MSSKATQTFQLDAYATRVEPGTRYHLLVTFEAVPSDVLDHFSTRQLVEYLKANAPATLDALCAEGGE